MSRRATARWTLYALLFGAVPLLLECSRSTGGESTTNGGPVTPDGGSVAPDGGSAAVDSPPFTQALVLPPVLAPTSTDSTTDYYDITIKTGNAQMRSGPTTPIVGFNGISPGPTIVATKGRAIKLTQKNAWTENVTIHNHGHKVAQESDGHPTDYITPGSSKVYSYPNDQRGSTYWYHDHTMNVTGDHVYSGLAGFYIIHDPAEDSLGLPSGNYDVPLVLQTKVFNPDNTLSPIRDKPVVGEVPVVDGVATPYFDVATRKYRLRFLNGTNHRIFTLHFLVDGPPPLPGAPQGEPFVVIGSDGGLLAAPVPTDSLLISPGERYDVVVDFSKYPLGTRLTLGDAGTVDTVGTVDQAQPLLALGLMQFVVKTASTDTSTVPQTLSTITRYQASDAVSTSKLNLSFSGTTWMINGLTYDPSRTDQMSKLDTVYIWELTGTAPFVVNHPFHKHLTEFQILDIDGLPPPPYQSGWKDTINVENRKTTRIIFKDEGFTGTYVFHCHKLDHEDDGMMLQEGVSR
jgi:FtsP/CotA-like multicopper oxidase with cupredoxin domain